MGGISTEVNCPGGVIAWGAIGIGSNCSGVIVWGVIVRDAIGIGGHCPGGDCMVGN